MKIAYLTNCFGTQSHTFMRREIAALRREHLPLKLYGIRADPSQTTADAEALVQETEYLYPLAPAALLRANVRYLIQAPRRYIKHLCQAFFYKEFSLRRRMKMVFHYFAAARLAADMQENGVTHIHAQFLNVSSSIAMYASQHSGIPFSITVHSAGSYQASDTLGLHQKLDAAQFLIMISEFNINYYDAISPCRHKSHVVRCGMNLDQFTMRDASQYQHQEPPTVMGVGRFVEKKGFIYLVQAAADLKQRGVRFKVKLIGSGPLEAELKEQVKNRGLSNDFDFLGQRSTEEVRETMAASDVVVVPSITTDNGDMEGLPVVIMEAMASGIPVIASKHSGIPEIVIPGLTGDLTPERDPLAIAKAIESVLSNGRDEQRLRARQLVEEHFNIEAVAKHRLTLFTQHQ